LGWTEEKRGGRKPKPITDIAGCGKEERKDKPSNPFMAEGDNPSNPVQNCYGKKKKKGERGKSLNREEREIGMVQMADPSADQTPRGRVLIIPLFPLKGNAP